MSSVNTAVTELTAKIAQLENELQQAQSQGRNASTVRKLEVDLGVWVKRKQKLTGDKQSEKEVMYLHCFLTCFEKTEKLFGRYRNYKKKPYIIPRHC